MSVNLSPKLEKIEIIPTFSSNHVKISLIPPKSTLRSPIDIICVIDVSGSMSTEATMKNEKGVTETFGLNLLDIVKHAVKTVVNNLSENDRLCLVSFSSSSKIVCRLGKMDAKGKKKVECELESLNPSGGTCLWDGLKAGLEVVRKNGDKKKNASILLLTDGCPTDKDHVVKLKEYYDKFKVNCSINTFGFGYSLDSVLLNDLAMVGTGMYSFIPDSSFVGTTFVNTMSNLLCTMATCVSVSVEHNDLFKIKKVLGDYKNSTASWGEKIDIGSICYGQSKEIVLEVDKAGKIDVTIEYNHVSSEKPIKYTRDGTDEDLKIKDDQVDVHKFRLEAVESIKKAFDIVTANQKDLKKAQAVIDALIKTIKSSSVVDDKYVKILLKDLDGQITEAVSRYDWFQKWGRHYLPSLKRAHSMQQCNNFKDPGIQLFGGDLFEKIRDTADDVFNKLPPPKPTSNGYGYGGSSRGSNAPVNMSQFNNCYNPCFEGKCKVLMGDGSVKCVEDLKKGDVVKCPNNNTAEIICVLKTICKSDKAYLVKIGELLITPYHPIKLHNKWTFPKTVNAVREYDCKAVYSFVLDKEHVMLIEGIQCVSLGHGFEDKIVNHPYFGSKKIVKDMEKMKGWKSGVISCPSNCLVRDEKTNLVCGFKKEITVA